MWMPSEEAAKSPDCSTIPIELLQRMNVEEDIMDRVETKGLLLYGYLSRMEVTRYLRNIWDWNSARIKRGRSRRTWRSRRARDIVK